MNRRDFIGSLSAASALALAPAVSASSTPAPAIAGDRQYWAQLLHRIAQPVLANLAKGTLVKRMPVEVPPNYAMPSRTFTYLEAVGRTLAGVAPWLALPDDSSTESSLRRQLREDALQGLARAVDPASPDYLNFRRYSQPLVDAAFLAHAFLRAPQALWDPLDRKTKQRLVTEFTALRDRKPGYNNWLLFAAMTETFLLSIDAPFDPARIDTAMRKLSEWYVGDGWYSDGRKFSFDYYNAYVIHPMLVDIRGVLAAKDPARKPEADLALKRMQRFGVHQERMISPEGSYPPVGRSITYRTGAFQALAQLALMDKLPEGVSPAQVRCALSAVTRRMYAREDNFDRDGWLQLGFVGHQPNVADYYTSTGSLYLATLGFLPLGLPATHTFWTAPAADWTAKLAWSGRSFPHDYHVDY